MAVFFWEKPAHICNQHFGQELDIDALMDAIIAPNEISRCYLRPRRAISRSTSRPDAGSKISVNKDAFNVSLDVQHFKPEEISLKIAGNDIVIEGKHEEKEDEHGSIYRHFVRRYTLPDGYSPNDVVSSLSTDGQLTITAPKKQIPENQERIVPIKLVEKPQKIEEKKSQGAV